MASISGTTKSGRSASISARSASGSLIARVAGVVRDLLAGGVVVAVDGDRLDAQALQRDQDFLAEFTAAQQHDAGGIRGAGGAQRFHGGASLNNP